MKSNRYSVRCTSLVFACASLLWFALGRLCVAQPRPEDESRIRSYIAGSWDSLSRSMSECKSLVDTKVTTVPVLYLPAGMAVPAAVQAAQKTCGVDVRTLPRAIRKMGDVRTAELPVPGLLYLPNRYVVPGGRFNEMYGWDSYFIVLGLLADGRVDLARGMVENFLFEIENYGAVLNANRTYFFTRSQPPFLSSMIREVYEHTADPAEARAWLVKAYPYARKDYALWVSSGHRAGSTGLARYHDMGAGPVPEMADDSSYYPDVIRWLMAHPESKTGYLVDGDEESCDAAASKVCATAVVDGHRLSAAFYRSDRAMRESGFDTSFRFGPFSGSTEEFAPVCLNSLLFKYEQDMAFFAGKLNQRQEAAEWNRRANSRRIAMNKWMWDGEAGMFLDYNTMTGARSPYRFITSFYPLWVGLATPAQAAATEKQLRVFEHPGGLAMSDTESGTQWDLPYGWAPVNWISVAGLARAGDLEDARRIATEFQAAVLQNFLKDGTIREKYNVVDGSANFKVAAGYKSNVVGFGWTNGVYVRMADLLAGKP